MSEIKLQVGKTYRNRKGKEVKIVEKDNTVNYPCLSSDGERYTESGKWSHFAEEHPKDLIEEVPEPTRHTFDIPDGVKKVTVEQVGNRIIVEMVPEEIPEKEKIENFLESYADGVMWSREQVRCLIEDYLKHREGE